MARLAQMISTRSEPLTPAPARTETLTGAGAVAQALGVLLLPTRKMKSAAVIDGCEPAMSIITPLMPLE